MVEVRTETPRDSKESRRPPKLYAKEGEFNHKVKVLLRPARRDFGRTFQPKVEMKRLNPYRVQEQSPPKFLYRKFWRIKSSSLEPKSNLWPR